MASITFETMSFSENEQGIEAIFLRMFSFQLLHEDLRKIGKCSIEGRNTLVFQGIGQHQAERKLNNLLGKGFSGMRNKLNNKPAVYIHRLSGIPLMGSLFIGISDKNVSTIEVKPITSCNTDCIFCSVDLNRRATDFVVEREYIIHELKKLVEFKESDYIEINVNPHGEPTLYAELPQLVADMRKIPQIKAVSMNTNGTLLTKKLMDDLIEAGMTRFNLSIHSIRPEKSKMLFNTKTYIIDRVKESCRYLAPKGLLLIAPVWVPGTNDEDMDELIEFAKEINAPIRLQNYQVHAQGRKVKGAREKHWDAFFEDLKKLEAKHGVRISGEFPGFVLKQTKKLPMPFKEGDIVQADIVCPGQFKGDVLASAKERAISIPRSQKQSGSARVRITRAKHNTFFGEIAN